jgi:hypothetical protein
VILGDVIIDEEPTVGASETVHWAATELRAAPIAGASGLTSGPK